MNEWEFTGDVSSWINEILARTPIPPFDRSKVEQSGTGSRKRRDLTILDKSKRVLLTGEVKLPYQADGNSPYITKIVADARKKARRVKARFFFTWNVNECVLWETEPADPSRLGQDYKSWQVTHVHNEGQLEHLATEEEIKDWLVKFLHGVSQILEGKVKIGRKPPDEKFIDALESALKMPIQFTYNELDRLYQKKRERAVLEKWMREEQGWTILDEPDGIRENLERASRFACYALVNKLVFHEALLKRYGRRLDKLRIQEHVDTGEQLWSHLEAYFKDAIKVTGDYETVFGEDHRLVGNRIPFYSNEAVPHWSALIDQVHEFDFTKLDYEIIGSLFERLLSPEERHKYGQYYTKVEIVDLINSFCIRRGDEKLMDPACGGGTFLVRAYVRMRTLKPELSHGDVLKNIFGADIMNFATHLSTINLVVRDLIDDENYPQIVRSDFFDIVAGKVFATLPRKAKAGGLGKIQQREVDIPPLDAIVGNPPYIRQEDIPKAKKPIYASLVKKEAGVTLSGRSDIHCYFWPHAAAFLKNDGHLCLLTSSQWLDVEYGFKLQEWILRNFEIQAVFESIEEPWFIGARVATTVTILKRQGVAEKRLANSVRFIQLRQPISEMLSNDGTIAGAMRSADEFRDELLAHKRNVSNRQYRIRLVDQVRLWNEGVSLGAILTQSKSEDLDEEPMNSGGVYYGGKWGIHLRAPDLWFDIIDQTGWRWKSLGALAEVRRGLTSGCDDFFYVRDVTQESLSKEPDSQKFASCYGVSRRKCELGEVVLITSGEKQGELHAIEARFLEPEVHSLMEISEYSVLGEQCHRKVVLIPTRTMNLEDTYAYKYIKWGEKQGFHKGITCVARVTEDKAWFDVTGHRRAPCLWPKERQYRYVAPANPERLIANCRLYEVLPPSDFDDPDLWGGILNSSWTLLSSLQYGRPMGNEGNWSTMVVDVNIMPVPDPTQASEAARQKITKAYQVMKKRKVLPFLSERRLREMAYRQAGREGELGSLGVISELDLEDRRALDDSVLSLLGVTSKSQREGLLSKLYEFLRDFFERTRQKEEKAIVNKNMTKRRGRISPADIAASLLESISNEESWLLKRYDPDFIDKELPFDTFDIPSDGTPTESHDMFRGGGLRFVKGRGIATGYVNTSHKDQDELVKFLVQRETRGLVRVPRDADECKSVLSKYSKFVHERDSRLTALIEERTSDEDLQEKILAELDRLISTK